MTVSENGDLRARCLEDDASGWLRLERRLDAALTLPRRPVGVAFRDSPPAGVEEFGGVEPAGCSFWRLAAEGRVFYTVPSDHYNCAIGSYTHSIPLPPERAPELEQTLSLMSDIGYVRMEEMAQIPQLARPPAVVVYAALGDTPVEPDVVLFSGRPGRIMLAYEAAMRAGVAAQLPLLGRPTCMAIPAALAQGTVVSTGCMGNRVYTDVGEDEIYMAIPGRDLPRVVDALAIITAANAQLGDYHRQRRQQFATE
jgi:uncharacterized protein (DUF169 family)